MIFIQKNINEFKKLEEDIKELSLKLEFYNNKFKSVRALSLIIGDEK